MCVLVWEHLSGALRKLCRVLKRHRLEVRGAQLLILALALVGTPDKGEVSDSPEKCGQ